MADSTDDRQLRFLENQCAVGTTEAKTVGHDGPEPGFFDQFGYQRRTNHNRIRIVDIDRRRDEIILEHEQAMNRLLHAGRAERMSTHGFRGTVARHLVAEQLLHGFDFFRVARAY